MRPRSPRPLDVRSVVAAVGRDAGLELLAEEGHAEILGITVDSRSVQPGDLYVALPGAHRHGAEFTQAALDAGAVAVVTDEEGAAAVQAAMLAQSTGDAASRTAYVAVVESPVRAWAGPLAATVYDTASRDFPLFAVTGTNGKTTTTYMINALQRALGRTTGIIGTIEIDAGGEPIPSVLTTPESPQVHGIIARMRENRVTGAAMEVSSHAIDFRRVDGLTFDLAGFTNLTQDHLDLHGTMEGYFASKADLFTSRRTRAAVVTIDDSWGRRMADHSRANGVETFTLSLTGDADYRVTGIERDGLGYRFTINGPQGVLEVRLPLPGDFNVANAALAVSLVLASGADPEQLRGVLEDGSGLSVVVPGRMQVIAQRPAAIVDFAHNPDALTRAITSVSQGEPGRRTIVVFGATGDRDATKREAMGRIAAELADVVIVTDDDPHGEDPGQIRQAVLDGARAAASCAEVWEVFPRDEAIREAVRLAREDDVILVAGRGHETIQEVDGVDVPLDDREELRTALETAGWSILDTTTTTSEGK